jgi:hypothetical protein
MTVEGKDFIWFAPRNHFYYVPTGTRWVKKGVEAAIGTHAIEEIIKNRGILDEKELAQILGNCARSDTKKLAQITKELAQIPGWSKGAT